MEVSLMRKNDLPTIVHEISVSTNQPEDVVSDLYVRVVANMKRDARILDFIPMLAARRVREKLRERSRLKRDLTGAALQ